MAGRTQEKWVFDCAGRPKLLNPVGADGERGKMNHLNHYHLKESHQREKGNLRGRGWCRSEGLKDKGRCGGVQFLRGKDGLIIMFY